MASQKKKPVMKEEIQNQDKPRQRGGDSKDLRMLTNQVKRQDQRTIGIANQDHLFASTTKEVSEYTY